VLQNKPWFVVIGLLGVKFHEFEYIGEMTDGHWRMGMPTHQWHFIGQWRGFIGQITHWRTERNRPIRQLHGAAEALFT
jgi:hypothetical protein